MALIFPAPAQIKNLLDPTASTDAATKQYVDNAIGGGGQDISAGNITASGNVTANAVTANVITSTGNVTGNILVANYFTGNGSNISSITGANVTGTVANANYAAYAGNITIATQPNITSVGTLSSLVVSGDANIQGNLTVGGAFTYINTTTIDLEDPIIQLGAGANGATLVSNNGYDRGTLLHNFTTTPVDAFMGWKTANNEFIFASNANVSAGVVTVNTLGNISAGNANLGNLVTANYFVGNGSQLTGLSQLTSTVNDYTGDGSTVSFALSATPASAAYTLVSVGGVMQPRSYYSVSGSTLTFSTAPPFGAFVEVTTLAGNVMGAGPSVAGANTQIQYNDSGVFGASTNFTFDNTTSTVTATNMTVSSTFTLGHWTTIGRPGSPTNGTMGFNSTSGVLEVYLNGNWHTITTS